MFAAISKLLALTLLVACLSDQSQGWQVHLPRETLFRLLRPDSSEEERLYLEDCKQSSDTGHCTLAIDGEIIQDWTQCASRSIENKGFWKAYLETPAYISRVVIHTAPLPDAAMLSALKDFHIYAGEKVCYTMASNVSFLTRSFPCDAFTDVIMLLSNRDDAVMPLCEIEVYGKTVKFSGLDSAAGHQLSYKTCSQSSASEVADCTKGFDNNYSQFEGVNGKTCVSVGWQSGEDFIWWEAEFQEPAMVQSVKIFNRLDPCCKHHLNHFQVLIGKLFCAKHFGSQPFETKILPCAAFGDRVRLESYQTKVPLVFCQIQVFGYYMIMRGEHHSSYLGCYKDNPESPDFELQVSVYQMSQRKCLKICKRLNKLYYALQNGRVCLCGNQYGRHGNVSDERFCNMTCEETRYCGGRNYNSVHQILN